MMNRYLQLVLGVFCIALLAIPQTLLAQSSVTPSKVTRQQVDPDKPSSFSEVILDEEVTKADASNSINQGVQLTTQDLRSDQLHFVQELKTGEIKLLSDKQRVDISWVAQTLDPNIYISHFFPETNFEVHNADCADPGGLTIYFNPFDIDDDDYFFSSYGLKDANGSIILFDPAVGAIEEVTDLSPGNYSVFFNFGTTTIDRPFTVRNEGHATAGFTRTDKTFAVGETIQFTNTSEGDIDEYIWDFGDATPVQVGKNPLHSYESAGTYDVTLTVKAGNCEYEYQSSLKVEDISTGFGEGGKGEIEIYGYGKRVIVVFDLIDEDPFQMDVYDLSGHRMLPPETADPQYHSTHELNLSHLVDGIYIIQMTNSNRQIVKKVLIE